MVGNTDEENELCLEIIETVFLDLEPWVKHDAYETYLGCTRSEFLELWQEMKISENGLFVL